MKKTKWVQCLGVLEWNKMTKCIHIQQFITFMTQLLDKQYNEHLNFLLRHVVHVDITRVHVNPVPAVVLERLEVHGVDVEAAVQMVHLVLDDPGQEARGWKAAWKPGLVDACRAEGGVSCSIPLIRSANWVLWWKSGANWCSSSPKMSFKIPTGFYDEHHITFCSR